MKTLHESLPTDLSGWTDKSSLPANLLLVKIKDTSSTCPIITHSLRVEGDLSWSLTVHGVQVSSSSCSALSSIPSNLNTESIHLILSTIDRASVCPGHPDNQFITTIKAKKGKLLSKDKSVASYHDTYASVNVDGDIYSSTVRCSNCEVLAVRGKCPACVRYRDSLQKIYHRWQKQKVLSPPQRESSNSHVNFSLLTTPEKSKRYVNLRTRLKSTEREVKRLKERIELMNRKDGITVSEELHNDLEKIMTEMSTNMREENPMDSFRQVFWEHQMEVLKTKDKRQIRWPPTIIKWCLHLKYISGAAYHALRSSFLVLPSERTLRDYSKPGVGFLPEVSAQMIKEANIQEDKDRYVVLTWDEMKIKGDLCFDKHTCELIGFTNMVKLTIRWISMNNTAKIHHPVPAL